MSLEQSLQQCPDGSEAGSGHAHGWQWQGHSGSAVLPVLRVLLWMQTAACPWMAVAPSRSSRGLWCCRLYHINSCAVGYVVICTTTTTVGCGVGGRGVDAGVEELHIVARNEAHPQMVEQSGEQKVTSGSNKLTYCGDVQGLIQSLRTLGRRGEFLVGWCISGGQ